MAARQAEPALLHDMTKPVAQSAYHALRTDHREDLDDLRIGCGRCTQRQVLTQRSVEQPTVLRQQADVAAYVGRIDLVQRKPVEQDFTRHWLQHA